MAATTTTLQITGMRCAGCVNGVEKSLKAVDGVTEASVNLPLNRATVAHDLDRAPVSSLIAAVHRAGFEASCQPLDEEHVPVAGHRHDSGSTRAIDHSHKPSHWDRQTITLIVLAVIVLVMGMTWHGVMSAWAQLLLATPVQILLGRPFYKGALRSAGYFRADMDTLVTLGTSIAYIYSFWATLAGDAVVYFDTAVMILVLVHTGRWLEARARSTATGAILALMDLQPPEAVVIRDGESKTVPVQAVRRGDVLLVRPGQRVPVDGDVIDGRSAIDQSMVTGESMPVDISPGCCVIGGTLNQGGAFRFRATNTGKAMFLSGVIELVHRAQTSKTHVQRVADSVAGVFVPVVMGVSLAALLGWGLLGGDWSHGLHSMVAVLIVACPCALGLATPMAIMVGAGLAAQQGILIKDAAAFERAGQLTHVVLDKTGTLTLGRPAVTDVIAVTDDIDADMLLSRLASVEQPSHHPIAQALVDYAKALGLVLSAVDEFTSVASGGVSGRVGGQSIMAGKVTTLREQGVLDLESITTVEKKLADSGKTTVAVAVDGRPVGVIGLADQLKPEAVSVVSQLRQMGLSVVLMTGDQRATGESVASLLGIDEVWAQVLPADKHARVTQLQREGGVVAMVGDGINDAPALAGADIGIAMGGRREGVIRGEVSGRRSSAASDIAMDAGHVVLVDGDLRGLPRAISLSRATMRRIHAGLFWAFIYNVVLIPAAAMGYLHPMLAAGAMSLSSVSVVLNALWLSKNWKP